MHLFYIRDSLWTDFRYVKIFTLYIIYLCKIRDKTVNIKGTYINIITKWTDYSISAR